VIHSSTRFTEANLKVLTSKRFTELHHPTKDELMRGDQFRNALGYIVVTLACHSAGSLCAQPARWCTVVDDTCPHGSASPHASIPGTSSRHSLQDGFHVYSKLSKAGTVLDLELQKIGARAGILLGVVTAFATSLDFPVRPLLREPGQPGFERSSTRVMVNNRRVDASPMG
jgi:hypothetical protein